MRAFRTSLKHRKAAANHAVDKADDIFPLIFAIAVYDNIHQAGGKMCVKHFQIVARGMRKLLFPGLNTAFPGKVYHLAQKRRTPSVKDKDLADLIGLFDHRINCLDQGGNIKRLN